MSGRVQIKERGESIQVWAADGRVIAYIYFDDLDAGRRERQGRWTRAEAIEWARKIARMATGTTNSPFK
ncbi:MAG: hypothetical protein AAF739_00195 [Pseudomonadota bacterium]